MLYQAKITKAIPLLELTPDRLDMKTRWIQPGVYILERLPNPTPTDPNDWLAILDTGVGAGVDIWLNPRFKGFISIKALHGDREVA